MIHIMYCVLLLLLLLVGDDGDSDKRSLLPVLCSPEIIGDMYVDVDIIDGF